MTHLLERIWLNPFDYAFGAICVIAAVGWVVNEIREFFGK